MALALMIDGVDHISELVHESLRVNQTNDGLNSMCFFDIRDAGVIQKDAWTVEVTRVEDGDVITGHTTFSEPKVEVSIVDGATVYFAGILSRIVVQPVGQILIGDRQQPEVQLLRCSCHDFNQLLEESIIDSLEEYVNQTDEAIIDDIFTKYVTGIDFATHVDGGAITIKGMSFENMTVRQMMDQLVARTNYVWYVDYSKKLHYSEAEANAPAWHLSDHPDLVNSFSYLDPVGREKDATNLVNMIFVVASTGGTWFTDAASRAVYGDHKAIIRDERLSITESIALKAATLLERFKDPEIIYTVKIYKDGLRAGMHIRFVCAYLDIDNTFLINRLRIEFPVDGEPIYVLTLGGLESSMGGAAQRLTLDRIYDPPPIAPSQLPLASRGWGHDLVFSSVDDDTVEWAVGTLTTASGQDFAIAAGNTDDPGAMTEKTIVYLDIVEDPTPPHDLQMTTDETAALGVNKIMVAVCWPSGVATVDAGFQVFGATGELATYLNATNVIANSITANEIFGNTLSVIAADMGLLTAGEIRMYANTWDVDADGFRLLAAEIAGQLNGVDQIVLSGVDGKLYAGANAVRLDNEGLTLLGLGDGRIVRFKYDDAGTERLMGQVYAGWGGGGADPLSTFLTARRQAGAPWPANIQVVLAAVDEIAATDVRLRVFSGGVVDIVGSTYFATNANVRIGGGLHVGSIAGDADDDDLWVDKDLRVGRGAYIGQIGVAPPADGLIVEAQVRFGHGLYVGAIGAGADDDDIWCDGEISTTGGTTRWELGAINMAAPTPDRCVELWINGAKYLIAVQPG